MKVLAVGAHFDDVELGCAGSLIKHVRKGHQVTIYVATVSSFHAPDGSQVRGSHTPREEGQKAADFIGARLVCGDFPTNNTLFNERLVLAVRRIIEEGRFDLVYTHWPGDVHLDHQNVVRATLSAARHVPNLLTYRSNWYTGPETFNPRFFVDISDVFQNKIELLKGYQSEFDRQGPSWIAFLEHEQRRAGLGIGVQYAEAFEVIRFRWEP
jgi:LmbE family N-acetylglucosaminyl deacetylase